MERQCLAVVYACHKLRHYLINVEVNVIVKFDPLKHLFLQTDLSSYLKKWVMLLIEFDLNFISQKSIKVQALTDYLAKAPCPHSDTCSTSIEFPDDNILAIQHDDIWELYFDGSKCKIGSSVGIILIPPMQNPIPLSYKLIFPCTNNIAEYEALIAGLRATSSLNSKHL